MSIDFSCPGCGQRYRVKDEFAGKSTKCTKCKAAMKVPLPPPPELDEPSADLSSLLDDELAAPAKAPPPPPTTATCPSCQAPLPSGAVLCIACGYDLVEKKRRVAKSSSGKGGKKSKGPRSTSMILLRGTAISAVGAVLGAIVWAMVAVVTGFQIGWVAWGVGAAAGGGMSYGADEIEDGTFPGIIAAFMALGGITLGKVLILLWFLIPLLNQARDGEDEGIVEIQRQIVAAKMVRDSYKQRGINPAAVDESTRDKDLDIALASLESLSPQEIERRHDEALAALGNEPNPALAQRGVAVESVADDAAPRPRPLVVHIPAAAPQGDRPSSIGIFFRTMFGPIDAVFILLAFFTAYKLGSGAATD